MDTMSKEQGASHEIIKATEVPDDGVKLIIRWSPDGFLTNEHVSEAAAVALGWRRQPEPPAPPAWMVEVAREANARSCDKLGLSIAADAYRAGAEDDADTIARSITALRLALERGHVVEARPVPNEEELLKASREDAAQACQDHHQPNRAGRIRAGELDGSDEVRAALQARSNMLKEGVVARASPTPSVDLEAPLKRAWDAGWTTAGYAIATLSAGQGDATTLRQNERERDVSKILSSLPTRET